MIYLEKQAWRPHLSSFRTHPILNFTVFNLSLFLGRWWKVTDAGSDWETGCSVSLLGFGFYLSLHKKEPSQQQKEE